MYAVIESGGQQHKVQENGLVRVDRLAVEKGNPVLFERVLLVHDGENLRVGTPTVDQAVVQGRVVQHLRGRKIRGFKYKAKKNYRRRFGHRSELTEVRIEKIALSPEELEALEPEEIAAAIVAEVTAAEPPLEEAELARLDAAAEADFEAGLDAAAEAGGDAEVEPDAGEGLEEDAEPESDEDLADAGRGEEGEDHGA